MSFRPILVLVVAALATSAAPIFITPHALPVQRLIQNLAVYIENKPDDPQLLYSMARLHYLALANESFLVPAFEREGEPPFPAPAHLADRFVWSARWEEADRLAKEALGINENTETPAELFDELRRVRDLKMAGLEEKGWLQHRTVGQTFVYSAVHARTSVLREMVNQMVDTAFSGSAEGLMMALLQGRELSAEEARRIRTLIDAASRKKRKARK